MAEEAVAAAGTGTHWWASIAWCLLGQAALHAGDPQRARTALLRGGGDDQNALQPSMRPLMLECLTSSAIAARLYLSPRTVETHLGRIYRKAGATSRAALAALQTRSEVRDGTTGTAGVTWLPGHSTT